MRVEARLSQPGGYGIAVHLPATDVGALWPTAFRRCFGKQAALIKPA